MVALAVAGYYLRGFDGKNRSNEQLAGQP